MSHNDPFPDASDDVKTAALAIAMSESRVNVLSRDIQLAEKVVHALGTYCADLRAERGRLQYENTLLKEAVHRADEMYALIDGFAYAPYDAIRDALKIWLGDNDGT